MLDLLCILSVAGIWPRYIEPALLETRYQDIPIADRDLDGLRIMHLSDLHLHRRTSRHFLNKVFKRVEVLSPDMIVFTGDFLCFAEMAQEKELEKFLQRFSAPYGCFASLGNHDYQKYISIDSQGHFTTLPPQKGFIVRSLQRLKSTSPPQLTFPTQPLSPPHEKLIPLLKKTPFRLLHNETVTIEAGKGRINITGLGDLWAGQCLPLEAFKKYDSARSGIILSHNPDSIDLLKSFPGELILCGHNHGGQVNIPCLWRRLNSAVHKELKEGYFQLEGKHLFVSRGFGTAVPLRFMARPEITLLTLRKR